MLFRAMRAVKRASVSIARGALRGVGPVGRFLIKLLVLPIYRVVVMAKLRIQRLALPARSLMLFFVTNRFLFHATVVVVALLTIITNLRGRTAQAESVGQNSLLFALATDKKTEIVEETMPSQAAAKNANYLGAGTIISVPHVDFDYDQTGNTLSSTVVVPGTIAAAPFDETQDNTIAPRTGTEKYIVQENDTISTIAHHFGVDVGTILWNNGLTESQYIRPGDTLKIPAVSGMLATVKKGDTVNKLATQYNADAAEIASFNNLSSDQQLALGTEIMIPGGTPPQIVQPPVQIVYSAPPPVHHPTTQTPASTPKPVAVVPVIVDSQPNDSSGSGSDSDASTNVTDVLTAPTPSDIPRPPNVDASNLAKNKLLWPSSGHSITQYYGWAHTGVDIDGDYSSPIYAADDGVVEQAGWNAGGYGLMILIDHPSGLKTRYGHSSRMFVKTGDHVTRGQVIGMIGTTGRSTGTHLHFEVYVGDRRTNPLAYIR